MNCPMSGACFKSLPDLVGRPLADPCDALLALDPVSTRAAARRYLDRLDALAPPRPSASSTRCPTTLISSA